MIAMSFRTFIIKVLVFIISNLLSFVRFGRHSTIDIPYEDYTKLFGVVQWILLYFANLVNTLVHWHKIY